MVFWICYIFSEILFSWSNSVSCVTD